jgi:hypothetical protein
MSTLVTTNLKNPSNPGNNLVLEANGSVLFSAGTATVPSISFTGDLNTGIYSPGADQVAISTGGSGRLFVDASGRVGVGSAPSVGNGIHATINTNNYGTALVLQNANVNGWAAEMQFLGITTTDTQAKIGALATGPGTNSGALAFYTANAGSYLERLRITSAGLVGVGTSSPSYTLQVAETSAVVSAASYSTFFGQGTRADLILQATSSNNDQQRQVIRSNSDSLIFGTENAAVTTFTEKLRIDSSGRLLVGTSTTNTNANTKIVSQLNAAPRGSGSPEAALFLATASSGYALAMGAYDSGSVNSSYTWISSVRSQDSFYDSAAIAPLSFRIADREALRIDSQLRLLVGTSSSSAEAKFIVQGGNTGSGGGMNIQRSVTTASAGSTIGFINFTNSSNNVGATVIAEGDGTWSAGTSHPTRLVLSTTADGASSPTERLRITSAGLVGIGTSSPGRNLHVAGSSATALIESTGSTNADLLIGDGGVRYYGIRGVAGGGSLQIRNDTANTTLATFTSTGLVGIGTTSLNAKLVVSTNNENFEFSPATTTFNGGVLEYLNRNTNTTRPDLNYYLGSTTGGSHKFWTDGTERARIDSSGRLLVGTSDGSGGVSKLVVQGASNGSAVGVAQISYNGLASAGLGAGTDIGYLRFTDQSSNSGVFAQITATADATSGANDYPGRLVFSTTADGASSPTERMRIKSGGDVTINTVGAKLDILSGGATSSWGQGIRIGHDATYYAGIFNNGDSNFDRQYLDFWTSRATSAGLIARLTDRFFCNVTTITAFSSERRYKQNIDIEPLIPSDCWTVARDLPIRTYEYKDNPGNLTYGPIVDEIVPIDPTLVLDTGREDEEGPVRTYDNGRLQAMYQVALQEALKRIEQLEAKVTALENA